MLFVRVFQAAIAVSVILCLSAHMRASPQRVPPVPGACCLLNGDACQDLEPEDCEAAGGQHQGAGTFCEFLECTADPCVGAAHSPGDFTDDSRVRGDDISGFVHALLRLPPVGSPDFCRANLSRGDHPEVLDAADAAAFVHCLLSGGACA